MFKIPNNSNRIINHKVFMIKFLFIAGFILCFPIIVTRFWYTISSFWKIRSLSCQSVLQIKESRYHPIYIKHDLLPLDTMVIVRQILLTPSACWVFVTLPSLCSSGKLQFNVNLIAFSNCNFFIIFLLKITGFKNISTSYMFKDCDSYNIRMRVPKLNKLNTVDKLRYNASIQVAYLIYENEQLHQQIENIQKQYNEIDKLFTLILSSEIYKNQQKIYKTALDDLKKVLAKAYELNDSTHNYIKEILINTKLRTNEISLFSNNNVSNEYLSIEAQHLQLKEDYQHLKNVSANYDSLLNIQKD